MKGKIRQGISHYRKLQEDIPREDNMGLLLPEQTDREAVAKLLYFDFGDYEIGSVAEMTWREAPQARKDIWLNKADQIIALCHPKLKVLSDEAIVDAVYPDGDISRLMYSDAFWRIARAQLAKDKEASNEEQS